MIDEGRKDKHCGFKQRRFRWYLHEFARGRACSMVTASSRYSFDILSF